MNALFDLFNDRERRTLLRVGLAAAAALVVVLVLFVRLRGGLGSQRTASYRLHESAQKTSLALEKARAEWKLWEDAGRDLAELRATLFYQDGSEIQVQLPQDLQKIFVRAGTSITDLDFSYAEMEKEQLRKTMVAFTYSGTYAGLKKLLAAIESFPKFLVVERIEFPKTGSGGERLSAKLTLAGYYGF